MSENRSLKCLRCKESAGKEKTVNDTSCFEGMLHFIDKDYLHSVFAIVSISFNWKAALENEVMRMKH